MGVTSPACLQDQSSRRVRQTFKPTIITFTQKGNAARLHHCLQNRTLCAELSMESKEILSSMWHVDSSKNAELGSR